MLTDCKSGGYNLEGLSASVERLTGLDFLIAIAYTITSLQGLKIKELGQQKYINCLQEVGRLGKRHSNFWIAAYGQLWIAAIEQWSDLAQELMRNKPHKMPFFQKGLHLDLYSLCLLVSLSPRQFSALAQLLIPSNNYP